MGFLGLWKWQQAILNTTAKKTIPPPFESAKCVSYSAIAVD